MFRRKKDASLSSTKELSALQRFGLFFFTRTRVTLLLWVLLTAFGAACYATFLPREGFPNVAGPYSTVQGTYFVGNKERVDREVSRPLAEVITKIPDVKKVSSQAGDNFFALQIEFDEKITSDEGNKRVENAVGSQHLLPAAAKAEFKPFFISKLTTDGDDLLISVASDKLTPGQLQDKADMVAAALRSDGVAPIDGAARVKTVDLFRRGTNPATGNPIIEQRGFDWIANEKNGRAVFTPSVVVAVQAEPGVDILHLDDATQKSLAQLRGDSNFGDINLTIAADFAESIRMQVGSLQENLLGGLLAVLVVSFILISFRASLITALSMTTVLAITIGALYLFGYSLNTITLFSLILCLGLIVDDTIIMAEAIDRVRRSGAKPREVVAAAIKKVALASTAGTLMTMMGFAPLLFVGGIMGEFIRAIPVTIIISLAMSLLVSITLIPFLARFTLLKGKVKQLHNPISRLETAAAEGLANLVRRVGRSRKQGVTLGLSAVGLSLVMLLAGFFFAGKLKFDIFPPVKDSDAIIGNINFAPGSSIADATQTSRRVNDVIADTLQGNVRRVSYQGSGSETSARVQIDLVPFKDRTPTSPELAATLQAEFDNFAGAHVQMAADAGPAPGGGFVMQIRTEENVKAQRLANAITAYLQGRELQRPNGTIAHLKDVNADTQSIQRDNGLRYVQINGTYDANDTSTLVPLTKTAVQETFPADRIQREFGLDGNVLNFDVGQEAENQDSFKSMVIAFPILLLAMYILLAIQFRSISQPLMIFLAIPFSFFGVTAGLYLTNNSFSFFTMLAIFALLGIAVNNTILLTDYANQGRKRGLRRSEAMATALEERFRPLLTTSLTSVVALIPLALSDPFWEGLAFTLIFGLLSSTFLVIVAFPYYYLGNELMRSKFNRWRALAWLAILIAFSLVLGKYVAKGAGSGFAIGYILVTIIVGIVRVLRRRRRT